MTNNPYILPGINKSIPKEKIIQSYFKSLGFSVKRLREDNRCAEIVLIRSLYMYHLRITCGWKLTDIGNYFFRHHASVIHSVKNVEGWMKFDPDYKIIIKNHNQEIYKLIEQNKTKS